MKTKRSRPWRCKSVRLPDTCFSTNSLSFAAAVPDVIGKPEIVRPSEKSTALAFSGIHVISPRLLGMMTEEGVFSILVSYLRLAGQGEKILAFRADEYYWRDLGKPENVSQAARDLEEKVVVE